MSGFFGIMRGVLGGVRFKPFTWKVSLEIELKARPNIAEIPITFRRRTAGKSKSNIRIGLKILWDFFWH